jgi:hypothetical protein
MALNDDEKGLSIEFFFRSLSSRRFAWNPEMQNLSSSKKFIRRFRKLFSTTLYLFFRSWWQIFVLLNARSQLLEVIFLLVQAEAQYNSVTINNISTVGVVKWGSSIFVLWCRKPWRASVTSESRTSSSPTRARWVFGSSYEAKMFFRALISLANPVSFLRSWRCGRLRKRKIRNLFLHVWFSKSNFDADRRCWRNVECFWSHRSRKEGLDNAGWSGRSYIVLLVVFVLNVDDGRMNGLSMLATMFSRLDVPNCDLVFMRLRFFISSTGWYRRHFSFSLYR